MEQRKEVCEIVQLLDYFIIEQKKSDVERRRLRDESTGWERALMLTGK